MTEDIYTGDTWLVSSFLPDSVVLPDIRTDEKGFYELRSPARPIVRGQEMFSFAPFSMFRQEECYGTPKAEHWIKWGKLIQKMQMEEVADLQRNGVKDVSNFEISTESLPVKQAQRVFFYQQFCASKSSFAWYQDENKNVTNKIRSHAIRLAKELWMFDPILFPGFQHSCIPNVELVPLFGKTPRISVIALRTIFPGDSLFYNRLFRPCESFSHRQAQFWDQFHLHCECSFCQEQKSETKKKTSIYTPTMLFHSNMTAFTFCFYCGMPTTKKISCCEAIYCTEACQESHFQDSHGSRCTMRKKTSSIQ